MAPQVYGWTCSACALDWVMRSAEIVPNYNRERAVHDIGYPENINAQHGLMNSNGDALRAVLRGYGQPSEQGWLNFDQAYARAVETTGMMSGAAWYHWVAVRGVQDGNLWIANSAPGYKGIYDILSPVDFQRLGGFSVVWLT